MEIGNTVGLVPFDMKLDKLVRVELDLVL